MRNVKVKSIKKYAILSLAVTLMSVGASYAATTWSDVQNDIQTTGSSTLSGNSTSADAPVVIKADTPPVPGQQVIIHGSDWTVTANGTAGSTTNYFIDNQAGANTLVQDIHFMGANGGNSLTGVSGGAIRNAGTLVIDSSPNLNGTSFGTNTVEGNGGAIANTGSGDLTVKNTTFTENKATGSGGSRGWGGAIYNEGSKLTIENSGFSSNTSQNAGGAIFNRAGVATISGSKFTNNSNTTDNSVGGAIFNAATMVVNGSDFTSNSTLGSGGAIGNGLSATTDAADVKLTVGSTTFTSNNSETGGGAIFNQGSRSDALHIVRIEGDTVFTGNYSSKYSGSTPALVAAGGAIYNASKTIAEGTDGRLEIVGTADKQVVFSSNAAQNGGAIANEGVAAIDNALFVNNGKIVLDSSEKITSNGGAIYNRTLGTGSAEIEISNTIFDSNIASDQGGAIYNQDGKIVITDSTFVGNTAGATPAMANGGAVYGGAGSKTTFRATAGNHTFIGNDYSQDLKADSIVLAGTYDATTPSNSKLAVANFEAENSGSVEITSNVSGNGNGSEINFNKTGESGQTYTGDINFKGDATLSNTVANIYNGKVSFAHDKSLAANNVLNMYGGTLNLLNNEFGAYQLQAKEFNLKGDAGIMLDVDLAAEKMDGIYKDNFGSITNDADNTLTVEAMKSVTDTTSKNVEILFTDADALIGNVELGSGAGIINGPIHKYAVSQLTRPAGTTDQGEYFVFNRIGDSDSVITGPVAAQAAFLLMDNLYRQSFANMDMVTLLTPEQRMAWKMRNKYANAGYHRGVYAPNVLPEERDGLYVRPFTNFENVPLKNGPKVSNVSYGTLIGGESDIVDLGHGWDGNFSFFGAYHGSHQAYNGNSIWQNGGTLGFVGTAYKGNFWTGVTANAGATAAQSSHNFGSEQFPIFMTGAAWKSGYNFNMLRNKLILQPSYMMSYTFVNVFDYTNAAGVKVTQDPLNAIEIIPGIRLIGNLKNGWQPYLGVNMTWNIMDKTKFFANEVALTQLSVKPYVEYGGGLQKRYGDRFTGYGQAMFRNGGRNGVAFTLGFRWALGN